MAGGQALALAWHAVASGQRTALRDFVTSSHNLLVITGAGISTSSGIPDYRSPGRPDYKPLQHQQFMQQESTRRRYWARSMIGFPRMSNARPNAGHRALHDLDLLLAATASTMNLITQNVDRLHFQAHGVAFYPRILELHGTIHHVDCLACKQYSTTRSALQDVMLDENADWLHAWRASSDARPDGDVELPADAYASFRVPHCPLCGGEMLKPAVVFHGGTIPEDVTARARALAAAADACLVVGSTVTTFSAFRLVRDVAKRGAPVAIVNRGATRADDLAGLKVEADIGAVLAGVARDIADARGVDLDALRRDHAAHRPQLQAHVDDRAGLAA